MISYCCTSFCLLSDYSLDVSCVYNYTILLFHDKTGVELLKNEVKNNDRDYLKVACIGV